MTGHRVWGIAAAAVAGVALVGASHLGCPLLVWNTTTSAPLGIYAVGWGERPAMGDWVFVRPAGALRSWLGRRRYLPTGALLLKRLAARGAGEACWRAGWLQLDGKPVAPLRRADRLGRPLQHPAGCRRVAPDEVLILAPDPASLDGRYFGTIPASWIVGRALPILTRSPR